MNTRITGAATGGVADRVEVATAAAEDTAATDIADGAAPIDGGGSASPAPALSPPRPLLPPRYQNGAPVSSAPMAAAPLRYDAAGRVAWDEIWGGFCDLALAGGPPHRPTPLEAPTAAEVRARPEAQTRVLDELERGLLMVTRWPVRRFAAPGWIGVVCPDAEAAEWLRHAIVTENVAARRQGATLLLPAGPDFRLEEEIKNVVTAVAKTHHYWMEHAADAWQPSRHHGGLPST